MSGCSSVSRSMSAACWLETTTVSSRTGRAVVVLDGDLGLAVGAQVGDRAVLADRGQPLGEPVRQRDRQRHQLRASRRRRSRTSGPGRRRPGGRAGRRCPRCAPRRRRRRPGRCPGDCEPIETVTPQDCAVEALLRRVVADVEDLLADDRRDVGVAGGGDLTGDVDLAGGDQRLDGDPALRVLLEQRVEDGVADLVGDLVRVAFGDRLGGEQTGGGGGGGPPPPPPTPPPPAGGGAPPGGGGPDTSPGGAGGGGGGLAGPFCPPPQGGGPPWWWPWWAPLPSPRQLGSSASTS